MADSHSALYGETGKLLTGVFQTLSAGNTGQLVAPGIGVPGRRHTGCATDREAETQHWHGHKRDHHRSFYPSSHQ